MASIEAQPAPAYFVLTAFYLLTGKPDPETERPATTLTSAQSALLPPSAASAYQASGDSIGYGVIGALHLGFHL